MFLEAEQMIVKMATLAPIGSPWHKLLIELGQEWQRVTENNVVLRIYPDGVAGDERDIVRKIRIGQLHAAAITTEGLSEISWDMNVFYIPLLFETFEDLEVIRNELSPHLINELETNGFKVLSWADIGWAYWFTRDPIYTPSDLKKMRIFNWMGDYYSAELWKKAGFHPIPMAFSDLFTSLQSGLIDAFATLPPLALSKQWFALAPHMLDLKWGYLNGAIIIAESKWNTIPPEYQKNISIATKEIENRSKEHRDMEEVFTLMQEYGLEIHELTPEQKNAWIELTKSFYPLIRGSLVPEEIFDRAIQLKEELED